MKHSQGVPVPEFRAISQKILASLFEHALAQRFLVHRCTIIKAANAFAARALEIFTPP